VGAATADDLLVIGASSVAQLDANPGALDTSLRRRRVTAIDQDAIDAGINLWGASSDQ
jgi:aryl-alcohol dehydrogenase-like predicted oxidoreductase